MNISFIRLGLMLCVISSSSIAELSQKLNKETGLIGWKFQQGNLELELIQRLPDQTRAFFMARGFPTDIADDLGKSCIFQTIIRNTDKTDGYPLTVNLKDWTLNHSGQIQPLKLKESWDQSWPDTQISKSARLAFRWGTFPTKQTFRAGDYNWGMISFGLLPGSQFALQLVWQAGEKKYSAQIDKLICAEDR